VDVRADRGRGEEGADFGRSDGRHILRVSHTVQREPRTADGSGLPTRAHLRGKLPDPFLGRVRPVVGTGRADPSAESRQHVVREESGLITATRGKLTTFDADGWSVADRRHLSSMGLLVEREDDVSLRWSEKSPTASRILASRSGSVENLKVSVWRLPTSMLSMTCWKRALVAGRSDSSWQIPALNQASCSDVALTRRARWRPPGRCRWARPCRCWPCGR